MKRTVRNSGKIILCIAYSLINSIVFSQDFQEVAKIVASDRANSDQFGYSVCISGNYAIVGAYYEDDDASGENTLESAGSAYIFERDSNGKWNEVQKIVPFDRAADDNFGCSVSLSGNYAIIGANLEDHDTAGLNYFGDAGSAYIYKCDDDGYWSFNQKIVAPNRAYGDQFGTVVSISGNYAIVAVPWEDEDAQETNKIFNSGSAYLFERTEQGIWNFVQKIVAFDRAFSACFGNAAYILGNTALVGASYESKDESGQNAFSCSGAAYIFQRDNEGNWNHKQKLVASDRDYYDEFGFSVCLSGRYAVIGAMLEGHDADSNNFLGAAGSAYIFEQNQSDEWTQVQKIVASDRNTNDYFGAAVSISDNRLIIGANGVDEGESDINTGAVYLFERSDDDIWHEVQKITTTDRDIGDLFGSALCISGNHIIVGTPDESEDALGNNTIPRAGAAYIFEKEICAPSQIPDPENIIENGDFGSCALSPWEVYLLDPNVNTINPVLVDGELVLTGITPGEDNLDWHIQLLQSFTQEQLSRMEEGASYELSFDARAVGKEKELYVFLGHNSDEWFSYIH